MARYIISTLVARGPIAPQLVGHDRAYLAAILARRFRGASVDPLAGQLHEHALAAQEHLGGGLTLDQRAHLDAVARATQKKARGLALADRTPTMAEVVRRLLDDAPSSCVALDRAVREAVTKRYAPSPAHLALAAQILEAVL